MTRPLVIQYPDGAEYGVKDTETAARVHPNATIVRYQDGAPYTPPPAPPKEPAPKPTAKTVKAEKL